MRSSPRAASTARITELDGWRGLSILLVVVGHLLEFAYRESSPLYLGFARALSSFGVEIFFVISGFIITRLALRERDDGGGFSISRFYVRRFFRIVPPFFSYLVIVALCSGLGLIVQSQSATLRAASFTCNLPTADCGWFALHSWTLSYEEQFYLLFPLIFLFSGKRSREYFLGLFVALAAFPIVAYAGQFNDVWRTPVFFIPSFSSIAIGTVIATHQERICGLLDSRAARMFWVAGITLLSVLLLTDTRVAKVYLYSVVFCFAVPISIAWLIASSLRPSLFTRVLNSRFLQFFGMISYSLYLWQQFFTGPATDYLIDRWFFFPAVMIVPAVLSYRFIERPSIRLGRRLLGRWEQRGWDLAARRLEQAQR